MHAMNTTSAARNSNLSSGGGGGHCHTLLKGDIFPDLSSWLVPVVLEYPKSARRKDRSRRRSFRYRTQPVTLQEISEVDESFANNEGETTLVDAAVSGGEEACSSSNKAPTATTSTEYSGFAFRNFTPMSSRQGGYYRFEDIKPASSSTNNSECSGVDSAIDNSNKCLFGKPKSARIEIMKE